MFESERSLIITGPAKDASPAGDRKLAQSAQMYHYQVRLLIFCIWNETCCTNISQSTILVIYNSELLFIVILITMKDKGPANSGMKKRRNYSDYSWLFSVLSFPYDSVLSILMDLNAVRIQIGSNANSCGSGS
jgi:hypothetical protein